MHYNFSKWGLDFGSGLRIEHCVCASLSGADHKPKGPVLKIVLRHCKFPFGFADYVRKYVKITNT